jgi:hypothetical protein
MQGQKNGLLLTFHNGVNWAALLAQATVNTLGHIDIISSGSSTAIHTFFSLDGDGLSRADGFAKLASNATFLARRIPSQRVFASEAG